MNKKLLVASLSGIIIIGSWFYLGVDRTEEKIKILSEKKRVKASGYDKPNEFIEYMNGIRTKEGEGQSGYPTNYRMDELKKAQAVAPAMKKSVLSWKERGPGNVGGRTRAVLLDPDDPQNKWIAGSVSGGIWKTTNAGKSWIEIAPDLPNLAITALARSSSDKSTIYAGTGEGFGNPDGVRGDGLFISTDGGKNWSQIEATSKNKDFSYVNKIIVDSSNKDVLFVATNRGLFKSENGGEKWTTLYRNRGRIQDLEFSKDNINTLFITERGVGILKSIDAGVTWKKVLSSEEGRFEVEPSIDPNKLFAVNESSEYYFTSNKGESWSPVSTDQLGVSFLIAAGKSQGWYDLALATHPYTDNAFFVGGVSLGKIEVLENDVIQDKATVGSVVDNTGDVIKYIDFKSDFWNGKIGDGIADGSADISKSDFVSVELRFGAGLSQKAHRFTVAANSGKNKDGGAGVPASEYSYTDYIDVPFEVWDVTNKRQLMVSFRDNERDGEFNLISRDPDKSNKAREYVYIHAQEYKETADDGIAKQSGHLHKLMYYFWPVLQDKAEWKPDAIGYATFKINWGNVLKSKIWVVADPYGYNTENSINSNLHPDHHFLTTIKTDESQKKFAIVNGNDGGVALSTNNGKAFKQLPKGYNTSQFYGAAKVAGKSQYFGGTQDNGTFLSPENSTASSAFSFEIGGDGFEVVCHATDPDKMIGGAYNNYFRYTTNGGGSWNDLRSQGLWGDGPFISRLGSSDRDPDLLVAVGSKGVWISKNFGRTWSATSVDGNWPDEPKKLSSEIARISLADPNVIWAGGGMTTKRSINVSLDKGKSFKQTADFEPVKGYRISGMATHPTDQATAYLLFSGRGLPKVIRTVDYGKTWEDLSQFEDEKSQNGFPDVAVYSLLVMPYDTNIIWVGTEIGLFESKDGGATWHLANNGLPAVSVWQMSVRDKEIVVATHGRGIWTLDISGLDKSPVTSFVYATSEKTGFKANLLAAATKLEVYVDNEIAATYENVPEGEFAYELEIEDKDKYYSYIVAYTENGAFKSNTLQFEVSTVPMINSLNASGNKITIDLELWRYYDRIEILCNGEVVSIKEKPMLGERTESIELDRRLECEIVVKGYIGDKTYVSDSKTIDVILSSETIKKEVFNLKIFPNPITPDSKIEIKAPNRKRNIALQIVDMKGRVMMNRSVSYPDVITILPIEYSRFMQGNYTVRVNVDGEILTRRFAVEK